MGFLRGSPHAYPVTLSALIVLYVSVEALGGSAALGILAFAIVVGNAPSIVNRIGFGPNLPSSSAPACGMSTRISPSSSSRSSVHWLDDRPPWSLVLAGVLLGLFLPSVTLPYGSRRGAQAYRSATNGSSSSHCPGVWRRVSCDHTRLQEFRNR